MTVRVIRSDKPSHDCSIGRHIVFQLVFGRSAKGFSLKDTQDYLQWESGNTDFTYV